MASMSLFNTSGNPSDSLRVAPDEIVDPLTVESSHLSARGAGDNSSPQGDPNLLTVCPRRESNTSATVDNLDRTSPKTSISSDRREAHGSVASSIRRISLTPAQSHQLSTSRSLHNQTQFRASFERGSLYKNPGHEFEALDEYVPPVPTNKCLQRFEEVVRRTVDPQREAEKTAKINFYNGERAKHAETLRKLRIWAASKNKRSVAQYFESFFTKKVDLPSQKEVVGLAKYHYPLRGNVSVYICDFGDDRFEEKEIKLGEIESYIHEKPDWSCVRWLHVPVNIGIVQSSIEDLFLAGGRDNSTNHTNDTSWQYPEFETFGVRRRKDLEDMRDIQLILKNFEEFACVNETLDSECLENIKPDILQDLEWRAGHLRSSLTYWDMVYGDLQHQLSSGPSLHDNSLKISSASFNVSVQTISGTQLYKDAQIVRYPFRTFHRTDGFVLTFSPGPTLDYLDAEIAEHLEIPKEAMYENEYSSVIALMREIFSKTGTSTWHKKTVDWFLIYLLTEIAVAPHPIRQGFNVPKLCFTYQIIIQNLKDKRYAKFERNESVKLVRQYLSCMDELSTMDTILNNKIKILKALKTNSQAIRSEDNDSPGNPDGESATDRVKWAIAILSRESSATQDLLKDLTQSLNELFQLRSIQQNELAIVADIQNKAILAFSAVTVIFLPLSFFTGYYGMNLKGLFDSNKTEAYFWKVCGSTTLAIVLIVGLFAFRHQFKEKPLVWKEPETEKEV